MLEQGFSADSADYDGRTALMLSAGKGHAGAAAVPCSQSYACAAARRQREACLVSRCRQTLAMYLLLHQRANRPRAPRVRLRAPPPARPAPLGGNGTHLKSARPCCARPRSRRRRWRRPRFLPPLYYPTLPPATRRRGGAAAGRGRGRGGARLPGRQRAAGRHKGRAPRGHRRAQRARHHVRAPPCALKPRARTAARSAARQRLRLPLGAPAGAPEGTWSVYSGVHAGTLGVLGTGLRQGSCVRAADCCVPRRDAAHASTCPCTRARPDMRQGVWEKPRSRLRQVRSVRQSITARADAWRLGRARGPDACARRLGLLGAEAAGRMCTCVHAGDLVLLRNLMRAGIDVSAARPPRRRQPRLVLRAVCGHALRPDWRATRWAEERLHVWWRCV